MGEYKNFKIKILFLILCLLIPSQVSAQEEIPESQDPASAYLVILGERAYAKGRTEEAIHEFSRALMLDPTNQQAQKRLEELGVAQDMLPVQFADPVELRERIKANEDKANQLIRQKNILEEELRTLKTDNHRLAQEKMSAQAQAKALEQASQTPPGVVVNVLEDYLEVREKELQALEEELKKAQAQIEILEREQGNAPASQ